MAKLREKEESLKAGNTKMIEILLVLSITLNIFLGWYGYLLLRKIIYASDNTSDILTEVARFKHHLTGVYELDTFYGDETLHVLLDHTKHLTTFLTECENAYALTEREFEQHVEDNQEEGEAPENEQGRG